MVEAVNYYGVKFLVGYSRWSNFDRRNKKLIKSDAIGKVHHIFSHYLRNNTWVRNVNNPKWFRRLNWRLYWEYCGGLMTELVSH
jgi:predicted dehydrogenase